jgi:hypothetical protein
LKECDDFLSRYETNHEVNVDLLSKLVIVFQDADVLKAGGTELARDGVLSTFNKQEERRNLIKLLKDNGISNTIPDISSRVITTDRKQESIDTLPELLEYYKHEIFLPKKKRLTLHQKRL